MKPAVDDSLLVSFGVDASCGAGAFIMCVLLMRLGFGVDVFDDVLNHSLIRRVLVASTIYFSLVFHLARRAECFQRPRSRAWIITVACALPAGPTSAVFTAPRLWDGTLCTPSFVYAFPAENYATCAAAMFVAFLACDTTFGVTNYAALFELLAGWVHHFMYSLFFGFAVTNGGFANGVATALPLELTTIILGLGHIWPSLRADMAFGASFFVLRIGYHGYVTAQYFGLRNDPDSKYPMWVFMVLALAMHVHWFYGWVKQQQRLRQKKSAEKVDRAS